MKKIITIILSLILVLSMGIAVYGATIEYKDKDGVTQKLSDFRDTKGHWAHDVILKWADYNIVSGNNGNFMPNQPIKRGDFCLILSRLLGLSEMSYNYFYDLPNDAYYRDAVLQCVAAGYVSGTSSTTVSPNGNATREQVATIIYRMLALDSSGYNNVRKFSDDYNIGSWAEEAVYTMRKYGYMNGDGSNNFNPRANITRAEIMQVLNNIAKSYIPKRDGSNLGSTFKSDFVGNLMVSRGITLNESSISGDLIMTENAGSIALNNTTILGRLYIIGKSTVTIKNSDITSIYLKKGVSKIDGISSNIDEVYVAYEASDSSLDKVPNILVLESGVRVKIDGIYYENNTTQIKRYKGEDIKNNIAAEQGSVAGGPKLSSPTFKQNITDNVVTLMQEHVTKGDSDIAEVGVIWLEQKNDVNTVLPTKDNYTGIKKYNSKKYESNISFEVGKVTGTCVYRAYAKDVNGVYSYSTAKTFTEYDFEMTYNLYDINYPTSYRVEIVFTGNNIPPISSLRCLYDIDSQYKETHDESVCYKSEESTDNYIRYIATIKSNTEKVNNEYIPIPYTEFGYRLQFYSGEVVQEFPILSNAIPQNATPLSELKAGYPIYDTNQIKINNNFIKTSYVEVLNEGIVYLYSNNDSVEKPSSDAYKWTKIYCDREIGINDSFSFNLTIPLNESYLNTFYCPFIKTANGYYYGDVQKVSNDYKGDEGGYRIDSVKATIFGNDVLLEIYSDKDRKIDSSSILSLGGGLSEKPIYLYENSIGTFHTYVLIRDLNASDIYNLMIRVTKATGEKSNIYPITINMQNGQESIKATNRRVVGDTYCYDLSSNVYSLNTLVYDSITTEKTNVMCSINKNILYVPKSINTNNERIRATFYITEGDVTFMVQTVFSLY